MAKDTKQETTVLNLRDMPLDLVANLKAAAAFERTSLKSYVASVLQQHVEGLQKKGILPKGK